MLRTCTDRDTCQESSSDGARTLRVVWPPCAANAAAWLPQVHCPMIRSGPGHLNGLAREHTGAFEARSRCAINAESAWGLCRDCAWDARDTGPRLRPSDQRERGSQMMDVQSTPTLPRLNEPA